MDIVPKQVIKRLAVAKRKPAIALVTNPLNERVHHTNGAYFYVDPKSDKHIILTGLLPSLKQCFWPNADIRKTLTTTPKKTTYMKNKKNEKKTYNNGRETTSVKKDSAAMNKGKGMFFGSIRGTQIHEQLADLVFLDRKNFLKKHQGLYPWSKRIIDFITGEMKWIPFVSEHHVYDEFLRIGTSIDMICIDPQSGRLVLLEFKTGYRSSGKTYFENYDGFMENSLHEMKNSPLNFATIQLVFSIIILMKQQQYRQNVSDRLSLGDIMAYVIKIDDETLDCYSIDNTFIREMTPLMYEDMKNSRNIVSLDPTSNITNKNKKKKKKKY